MTAEPNTVEEFYAAVRIGPDQQWPPNRWAWYENAPYRNQQFDTMEFGRVDSWDGPPDGTRWATIMERAAQSTERLKTLPVHPALLPLQYLFPPLDRTFERFANRQFWGLAFNITYHPRTELYHFISLPQYSSWQACPTGSDVELLLSVEFAKLGLL